MRVHRGRVFSTALTVLALGVTTTAMSVGGASAQAPASRQAASSCAATGHSSARIGRFSGIVFAQKVGCLARSTDSAANGTPPLIFHGGPVMGTNSTGPVVITPIFWNPASFPMSSAYKGLVDTYLNDVAVASGTGGNVYSILTEYFGSDGAINYRIVLGAPINDTDALPKSACKLEAADTSGIYADGSGYGACLSDAQVLAETNTVASAQNLPTDFAHIYVMFLPKHVETCFQAGTTATSSNGCTINHEPSAQFCAYHSFFAQTGTVYANMAYPIYASPVGFTCSSDAIFPVVQSPNGNPDADTEIGVTSHEVSESITDPNVHNGWFDSTGNEIGDECAFVYDATKGAPGARYNQVINGHRYLTQTEFSNRDFAVTGLGCLEHE